MSAIFGFTFHIGRMTEVLNQIYIELTDANKPHQNEAGRSHRPVAVYLMKLQEHRFKKNHFKYFLTLYSFARAQNCKKQI